MSTTLKPNDFKNNPEGAEIYKQYILVLEKKIRNLEKRKAKLDDYKVKQSSGTELNEDQKLAVSHYSEVLVMLEALNDLHKTYVSINNDIAKNLKKQAKKAKIEKDQEQTNNVIEVLKLYYVFSALQVPKMKEELVNPKNNSFAITEEEFKTVKNLLLNIFDSTSFIKPLESISKASDHIVSLVSNREKPFLNTESTYKSIKTLIDKLIDSGSLDLTNVLKSNDNPSITKSATTEKTAVPSSVDSDTSSEDNDGMVHVEKPESYPTNLNKELHEGQNVTRVSKSIAKQATGLSNKNGSYVDSQKVNKNNHINGAIDNKSDTRTLNDLLASFQSGFQFMQDSLIEPERQTYFS